MPAIEVVNLVKRYPAYRNQQALKEWVVNLPRKFLGGTRPMFNALNNVNFSVDQGECLGVIGRNGAGKSTLLSLLLGTTYPTEGEVRIAGKRTPLLELGAGFHPDLTGRENVVINAVLLGLTRREAEARSRDIIEFSEIEPFIDMPARTYSSGMYLRLAFSVAIHTDPQVLLIDEILAVGDESFQKKSGAAITRLIKGGVTTVFVSHNLEAVRSICNRAIWLDHGKVQAEGEPAKVVEAYQGAN